MALGMARTQPTAWQASSECECLVPGGFRNPELPYQDRVQQVQGEGLVGAPEDLRKLLLWRESGCL